MIRSECLPFYVTLNILKIDIIILYSHPISSYPIPSYPIPSYLIPPHPIPSHLILSYQGFYSKRVEVLHISDWQGSILHLLRHLERGGVPRGIADFCLWIFSFHQFVHCLHWVDGIWRVHRWWNIREISRGIKVIILSNCTLLYITLLCWTSLYSTLLFFSSSRLLLSPHISYHFLHLCAYSYIVIWLSFFYCFCHYSVCKEVPSGINGPRSLLPVWPTRLLSLRQRAAVSTLAAEQRGERVDKRERVFDVVEGVVVGV